ncbi:hypothetical protein ACJX0J_007283, partial [Zea mays]
RLGKLFYVETHGLMYTVDRVVCEWNFALEFDIPFMQSIIGKKIIHCNLLGGESIVFVVPFT